MADDVKGPGVKGPGPVRRALAGHAAIGLLAGALLYLICLSGMLAVLQEHWQRWEEPAAAEMSAIPPGAVQAALANTLARQGKPTTHAYVHMPTDALPRVVVTTDHGAAYVKSDGSYDSREAHSWTEFVLNLHYYLHLPPILGLIVTGAFGVMLVALSITGVIAHPRIFRDAFHLRARGQRQLAEADLHNRLGVWLLPFIVALGLTGGMIGMGQIMFQAIASERHGGDIEAAYASIFGDHPAEDHRPAPLARADRALAWMAAHAPGHRVTYVTIDEPMTAGQQIAVLADHDRRLIYGETYLFDGSGRFVRRLGLSDGALGKQAIASVYKVHFGNFGGVPVELAYLIFGLALCAIIATGTNLWLMKRRARGAASPRLESWWSLVVWGSPLAIALLYWLRVIAGPDAPLAAVFWGALAIGSVLALAFPHARTPAMLRCALGVALAVTGAGHFFLSNSLPASSNLIDLALLLSGVAFLGVFPVLLKAGPRANPAGCAPEPAVRKR